MKTGENTEKTTESAGKGPGPGRCCPESATEMFASCCQDVDAEGIEGMKTMMSRCCSGMKICRWFPSIPVVLGLAAFLLGYVLGPETVRILWLIASGTVALFGVLGLIMMGSMCRA